MATKKTHDSPGVPYGWCLAHDHDTDQERGGCPIQVGQQAPCACDCHQGATEPRGILESRLPSAS